MDDYLVKRDEAVKSHHNEETKKQALAKLTDSECLALGLIVV